MNNPTTIDDQIDDIKRREISYRNLHLSATITITDKKTISIPYSSVMSKYKDYLSNIIVEKELNDTEYYTYRYAPKRLSLDLYGTIEFWDQILVLNECISIKDFNMRKIKYYDPSMLKKYINEIFILEESMGNKLIQ